MSDPLPPASDALLATDPNALTSLFDVDPMPLPDAALDNLIAEYRRRANVHASEAAAAAAAPKTATGRRRKADPLLDAAAAAIADKPISELTLDDLLPPGAV